MVEEKTKPWRHPSIANPSTGESGKWQTVNGRSIFVPAGGMDPDEVGHQELSRWSNPKPTFRDDDSEPVENPNDEVIKPDDEEEEVEKDGQGYGDLAPAFNQSEPNEDVKGETYIGRPAKKSNRMADLNKIATTKIGDEIHYYQNGVDNGRGIVVKMGSAYITVAKEDGTIEDIHINETFFVKDIIVNKVWDSMDYEERERVLVAARVPSPRLISKSWREMPQELKDVLTKEGFTYEQGETKETETKDHERTGNFQDKSDVEPENALGTVGSRPDLGVSGNISRQVDAPEDYEGQTHDDKSEEFKHEELKPETKDDGADIDPATGKKKDVGSTSSGSATTATSGAANFVYSDVKPYKVKKFRDVNVNTWGLRYTKDVEEE
ncbi:MAG: hypothetical protein H8D92_00285 [Pelagibacteraceae bacterium]|nr:hypothetical protein [Pelagibacteraceae bacterium]